MIYVIANWKMNPQTAREARILFDAMISIGRLKNIETIVCPPFPFLPIFGSPKSIKLGGQDLFWELEGPYTGQVSGKMLKDLGCEYVIVGHSEKRRFGGEDDEIINLKLKSALKAKLKPILCIGEQAGEEPGEVLTRQIRGCLADIGKSQISELIIAYEPVWAIGSGNSCLPDNAFRANLLIKKILTALYSRFLAEKIPVVYGGSVDSLNGSSYLKEAKMLGLLVGGASLEADEFSKIANSLNDLV